MDFNGFIFDTNSVRVRGSVDIFLQEYSTKNVGAHGAVRPLD